MYTECFILPPIEILTFSIITYSQIQADIERYSKHPNRKVLASDDNCGKTILSDKKYGARIDEAINADLGEFPWTARIGTIQKFSYIFNCIGSLIGPNWVVTAAHCVHHKGTLNRVELPHVVRLGEYIKGRIIDCQGKLCNKDGTQNIEVKKVLPHPGYKPAPDWKNDICLLGLKTPAKFSEFVRMVCLPFEDDVHEKYSGVDLSLSGWGFTTVRNEEKSKAQGKTMQKLVLRVYDVVKCKKIYSVDRNPVYTDLQICAGGIAGRDSCGGDSGAGLVLKVDHLNKRGVFNLIGHVSWGPQKCGTAGKPGVYIKIRSYIDWILNSVYDINDDKIHNRTNSESEDLVLRMMKRPIRYNSLHSESKDTKNEGNNTTTLNTTAGCTISNPSYKLIIYLILSLSLYCCLPD